MRRCLLAGAAVTALVCPGPSTAGAPDGILYQPPAPWVVATPSSAEPSTPSEAPVRFAYADTQVRVGPDGTEQTYSAYRIKILKPEGLSAGNIAVSWQPDSGSMTVHYVRLIRDGKTTDVLASTPFKVLQREAQLEQSVLTGQRTATLQVPGVEVGDEIAFAVTTRQREAAFVGRVAGVAQLPVVETAGAFRFRLLWPKDRAMAYARSADLPAAKPEPQGDERVLDIALSNPTGAIPTEGAPARYNVRRLVEYSDFGSWRDLSRELSPLFERAAGLAKASPIKAEAAAIAAKTADPVARAQAALQLVQDRVRYVYVALNGGNYLPASAEETWQRRFGDCKAKSVLLAALLRELGIEAAPALVNSGGGDGTDERLPSPRVFDHMIVRAVIGGKVEWLDGTRLGDRYLDNLALPYRWALPLSTSGSALETIAPRDTGLPALIGLVDIDATAGLDHDAHVTLRTILRGDEAFAIRAKLASLSPGDAERTLKSYWRQQADWLTPDKVLWTYDERRMAVSMEVVGSGDPGWKGDAKEGRSFTLPGAGFNPPDRLKRPADQDQSAGWQVPYPRFRCWATTVRLPKAEGKLAWSLYADPMNRRLGGFTYWRAAGFDGKIARTVMSTHSYEPEATPAEAAIVNRSIAGFNNNMSSISEVSGAGSTPTRTMPFDDRVDWVNAPTPCSAKP